MSDFKKFLGHVAEEDWGFMTESEMNKIHSNFYENRGEKTPSGLLARMRLRRKARPRG
ncbi:hypothetical protein M0R72_02265 [Candidatus Pacearchaeota archaeon]|jgi:hypothetical protein|nr:hypothetical protein [Candidatus Pacearchaeota archaeon]